MTEGLAWHDRRVEDKDLGTIGNDGGLIADEDINDLDQQHIPYGPVFIEVTNPWSTDGQLPAELYSKTGTDANPLSSQVTFSAGVQLDRLSNQAAPHISYEESLSTKKAVPMKSPVWRMACVEDHPELRNRTASGNELKVNDEPNADGPWKYTRLVDMPLLQQQIAKYRQIGTSDVAFRWLDPDALGFDQNAAPKAAFPASEIFTATTPVMNGATPQDREFTRQYLLKPTQYIERVFYFTAVTTDDIVNPGVRVPDLGYQVSVPSAKFTKTASTAVENPWSLGDMKRKGLWQIAASNMWVSANRFVSLDDFDVDGDNRAADNSDPTKNEYTPLAPILPGRCGLIGTAGANYSDAVSPGHALDQRYTSTLSWPKAIEASNLIGPASVLGARRIELKPSINSERQQVIVKMNGGDENSRVAGVNITSVADVDDPVERSIQPCVAIPVRGMSISTPLDGYLLRRSELEKTPGSFENKLTYKPLTGDSEGVFTRDAEYQGWLR